MTMKSQALVVAAAAISVLMVAVRPASGFTEAVVFGGRMETGGETNGETEELGRFAVEEYNKQQQMGGVVRGPKPSAVEFKAVVAVEKQVIAGIKYYLKIAATEDGVDKMFDAEVAVTPWEGSQELLSFVPAKA